MDIPGQCCYTTLEKSGRRGGRGGRSALSQPVTRIDMTQGAILSTTIRFALPICAGNVLQQLYSTVYTLVIGNFCDSTALAAVATSSQPL